MVLNNDELYRHPTQGIKHGDSIELMCRDDYTEDNFLNGKVIGEFICDIIFPISIKYSDPNSHIALKEFPYTCLTDKQIIEYLGNGQRGYAWHISDLVIYDNPKELSEFYKKCDEGCEGCYLWQNVRVNSEEFDMDCSSNYYGHTPLTRPPQSWCYIEEENE